MKIILSLAKKMNINQDIMMPLGMPKCIDKPEKILSWMGVYF